ncbi:type II toxin-antitoxin system VapC family toxin [Pseudoduganella sp. OTU4001]|uniref:type II toxin-antitoxin system VapC family toxin n=1 Tax=Pseudoduganella sp. OTU4001 TaxID=3043854 RepID=UPI00313AC5D1
MKLVLDASVALAWVFERSVAEERSLADSLLDPALSWQFLVPPLWHIEVANGLLVGRRRGLLQEALAVNFLHRLYCLPITTDKTDHGLQGRQAFALGQSSGLTAYDACYLDLALREGAMLATFDRQLQAAARKAGARLLE